MATDAPSDDVSPFAHIQNPKKRAFLAALVVTGGNKRRAVEGAGIDSSTPYTRQWREDKEFQEALRLAEQMGADLLEAEAVRRAHDGVEEPVGWYRGQAGGTVRRYSDTLLIFLLKGAKPEKYGDKPLVGDSAEEIARRIQEALAESADRTRIDDAA